MKVELPTPRAHLQRRRQALAELFDAEVHLPRLVHHLSDDLLSFDRSDAHRWAGWLRALQKDPAWSVLEPALDSPSAWPAAWTRARSAGFSPASDHFQAIFFTELVEAALAERRLELALQSWLECLASWQHLAVTGYLSEALGPLKKELTEDQFRATCASLLDRQLRSISALGMEALRLDSWASAPARRPLEVTLQLLDAPSDALSDAMDTALGRGLCEAADEAYQALNEAVARRFQERMDAIDFATVQTKEILALVDGLLQRNRCLDHPVSLDRLALRQSLNIIWEIRELERDEELAITEELIERVEPCSERLQQGDDEDFFGLQGAMADLLVFKGEEALSLDVRQRAFEEALKICPGHRNASRLLSYLYLERANRDLLKTAAMPDAGARLGPLRRRIKPLLQRASALIDEARETYPENDLLHRYEGDLKRELERFTIVLTEDDGDDITPDETSRS